MFRYQVLWVFIIIIINLYTIVPCVGYLPTREYVAGFVCTIPEFLTTYINIQPTLQSPLNLVCISTE